MRVFPALLGLAGALSAADLTLVDAARATLRMHPLVQIQQQQVSLLEGVRREAGGAFDTQITTGAAQNRLDAALTGYERLQALGAGISTASQGTNLTTLNAGATKLLRSGIAISPEFDVTRRTDHLSNLDGVNTSRLGVQVTVPLMRGRGRDVVAARETAAGIDVGAGQFDLNATISDLLAGTASAYWTYLASVRELAVAVAAEERSRVLVEHVREMIDADRVPRNDIHQVEANLADRKAARIAADQRMAEARESLALAMGIPAAQLESIGEPSDDFPAVGATAPVLDSAAMRSLVGTAMSQRADLSAAKKRLESARVLRAAAVKNLLPKLDLNLSGGYSGLKEGRGPQLYLAAPFQGVQGPDATAGITYQFPRGNNAARGQLQQAEAAVRQAELRVAELQREITSTAAVAAQGLRSAARRLERAEESVRAYEAALAGEREKFGLGQSSLIDILVMEDRLTSVSDNKVEAQLAYALALARLRQATGTLVPPSGNVQDVNRDVFVRLPKELQ